MTKKQGGVQIAVVYCLTGLINGGITGILVYYIGKYFRSIADKI